MLHSTSPAFFGKEDNQPFVFVDFHIHFNGLQRKNIFKKCICIEEHRLFSYTNPQIIKHTNHLHTI